MPGCALESSRALSTCIHTADVYVSVSGSHVLLGMGVSCHVWLVQVNADSINDISAYASDQDKFSPGMPNHLLHVNCIASVQVSQPAQGPVLTFTSYSEHGRQGICHDIRKSKHLTGVVRSQTSG